MSQKDYLIYSIEDDPDIADILSLALRGQGYSIVNFENGEDFFSEFAKKKPDMILLDMMLPTIQGREILKAIRKDEENKDIIIIIVSAKSMVSDKIDGLNLGADDYIAKPFDINEFISRINAHYRRHSQNSLKSGFGHVLSLSRYKIDFDNKTLWDDKKLVDLTPSEYNIVSLLFKNHRNIVSKEEISKLLYGPTTEKEKLRKQYRTIDMLIKDIRTKINDNDKDFIKTVFGTGYVINE